MSLRNAQMLLVTALLLTGAAARAQTCQTIDFDDPALLGHAISNQYQSQGVLFSLGGGCSGLPAVDIAPFPHSPDQVLRANAFNSRCCITINFLDPQRMVELYVSQLCAGPPGSTITVYASYNSSDPNCPSWSVLQTVVCPCGPGGFHTWQRVQFVEPNCCINQIDVCAEGPEVFYIDDLSFGDDTTDPFVSLYDPWAAGSPMRDRNVVCSNGLIDIWGRSCDADACGYSDELQIRSYSGIPGTPVPPWTVLASAVRGSGPCPTFAPAQLLYSYPASSLLPPPSGPYAEGWYQIQVQGTNDCGGDEEDNTLICLDRNPPVPTLACPHDNQIVRGDLPICGAVFDVCGVDQWDLSGTGPLFSFTLGGGTGTNVSGTWSTGAPLFPDGGPYTIFLGAWDQCGQYAFDQATNIMIDNTLPIAEIWEPMDPNDPNGDVACNWWACNDEHVPIWGVAYDANIESWVLEVSVGGGPYQFLAGGTSNVGSPGNPQLLATWDTCCWDPNDPPPCNPCCFNLRLVVEDKATSCCIPPVDLGNVAEDFACGQIGRKGDINRDGEVNFGDINPFINELLAPPCPCPCPCSVGCPPGGVQEAEPCGGDLNGGCNANPFASQPIACGQTICGTTFWNGSIRDTDWYRITTTAPRTFTVTGQAEFDMELYFVQDLGNDCLFENLWLVNPDPCDSGSLTTPVLPPGDYYVVPVAKFRMDRVVDCSDCNHYWVRLTCQ